MTSVSRIGSVNVTRSKSAGSQQVLMAPAPADRQLREQVVAWNAKSNFPLLLRKSRRGWRSLTYSAIVVGRHAHWGPGSRVVGTDVVCFPVLSVVVGTGVVGLVGASPEKSKKICKKSLLGHLRCNPSAFPFKRMHLTNKLMHRTNKLKIMLVKPHLCPKLEIANFD